MRTPTLTLSLPSFGEPPLGHWRNLVDLARHAEDAGIDRVVVPDHVVMGRHTERYSWGRFPLPPEGAWMEPLTVLTAMAASTTRIRLSTGILIAGLRPAALLAKTVATIDQLSGGRLDLGVGTGWQPEEYEAEGLDFERRGQLLTDTVAACRALWDATPASFGSESLNFSDIFCEPKPMQQRLPVWFAGVLHRRNVRRVVELGDGWIPIMGATVDDIRHGSELLRSHLSLSGRSPDALGVQAPAVLSRDSGGRPAIRATLASVPSLLDAGATDIQVNLRSVCRDLSDAPAEMTKLAEEFASVIS